MLGYTPPLIFVFSLDLDWESLRSIQVGKALCKTVAKEPKALVSSLITECGSLLSFLRDTDVSILPR